MLSPRKVCWLLLLSSCISLVDATAADLTVIVRGVPSARGHVLCAVYPDAQHFLKQTADSERMRVAAKRGDVQFVFHGLAPGRYAVTAFHDANDNGRVDLNSNGVPTELVGFSNDARGIGGPPSFQQASFELPPGGKTLTLYLE